ncbi:MAG: hypothetical protein PHH88_01840, partial [Candidatus Pacebacteria bacterium]|nr:hypothetical protein [Candidatus Paceibacterota bacterium]
FILHMNSKIAIPCHWNKELLEKIVQINEQFSDTKVVEVYGALSNGPVKHGRIPSSVIDINREDAINFRNFVREKEMKFVYLLNAPFTFKDCDLEETKNYLHWIINIFKADALMVTSHDLMKFIRLNYSLDIPIYISTIAGIKSAKEISNFLDINPKRVVPHHDVNRNFNDLQELIKKTKEWDMEIELMATESCLRGCPDRKRHYDFLAKGTKDKVFHTVCNKKRIEHPAEFLKSNFIRPEDLSLYEKMGIKFFKITGRSKEAGWLPEVVEAYLRKNYKGNLIRLLGIDPSLNAEKWIYINNKALDAFLEGFPKNKKGEEAEYCEEWISKLYKNKDFYLKDDSKYALKDKTLYCYKFGKIVSSLLGSEL